MLPKCKQTIDYQNNFNGYTYTLISPTYLLYCVFEGVRYFTRGVDCDGHVANYVETEQIIVYKQHTASFVQVGEGRGILIKVLIFLSSM